MSELEHRFFGWNTNTDWTKCSSKDCIETIGVFAIDSNEETNHFQNLCNLSNMIESDKSSYDNGDISYGTAISFFNQVINFELEKDDKWWSDANNFHQMLTTEKNETIGSVKISYKKDYFKMEFEGHMYTGMNFELESETGGVEPCTVFFGSDETLVLEKLYTNGDNKEIKTDEGKSIAIPRAYGSQSIFISKTGPLDYKPFCDESLQFGLPEPEKLLEKRDEPLRPDVVVEPIEEEEITPEVVDTSVLDALPPQMMFPRAPMNHLIFLPAMIGEPVILPDDKAYKARMQREGFIVTYDFDVSAWPGGSDKAEETRELVRDNGVVTGINLFRLNSNQLSFSLILVGVDTGEFYNSTIRTF
jgi:hypothetical protein